MRGGVWQGRRGQGRLSSIVLLRFLIEPKSLSAGMV
jgi:hypothetical protein